MERERSWEQITATGLELRRRWQELADCHGLSISHSGLPALTGFAFNSAKALEYKTLITQQMLKRAIGDSCYTCLPHTSDVIEPYLDSLDGVRPIAERGRALGGGFVGRAYLSWRLPVELRMS